MSFGDDELVLSLMRVCGDLAQRCLNAKRDVEGDRRAFRFAGRSLRLNGTELICAIGHNPLEDCAGRLRETASEKGVSYTPAFGQEANRDVLPSWRDLQLAEAEHQRLCDLEIAGLPLQQQMCRYAISLTAIAGAVAQAVESYAVEDESWRAFVDLLLISLRFSTIAGESLTDHPVPRSNGEFEAALSMDGGGF